MKRILAIFLVPMIMNTASLQSMDGGPLVNFGSQAGSAALMGVSALTSVAQQAAEHTLNMILDPVKKQVASYSPYQYLLAVIGLELPGKAINLNPRVQSLIRLVQVAMGLGAMYSYFHAKEKTFADAVTQAIKDHTDKSAAKLYKAMMISTWFQLGALGKSIELNAQTRQRELLEGHQSLQSGIAANQRAIEATPDQTVQALARAVANGQFLGGVQQQRALNAATASGMGVPRNSKMTITEE